MKARRCPNGCDPREMERDSWDMTFEHVTRNRNKPLPNYGVRYTCHGCGWEADWNPEEGLVLVAEGRLGPL